MRRYVVFGVVALALLLASINNSSATVAISQMRADFNVSVVVVGWVLTAYQLVNTIGMAIAGKISDVIGARKAFITYTALFLAGSLLSGMAPNVYLLIGARAVQAMGGGGFMPCAAGIVSNTFPENRQRYIGLFSSIFPIGAVIGPNIGGFLVQSFGWRSIFWMNAPLAVGVLILGWALLPRSDGKASANSIDVTGAGLLFGTLASLMLGITTIGKDIHNIPWAMAGSLLALSMTLLVIFLRWEKRAKEPIIDFALVKERPFMAANIYNVVYGICALGVFSLIPLYAVTVFKMTVFQSGVLLTPRSIGMMLASTVTSFSLVKWGYRKPILFGTVTVAAALFLLSLQSQGFGTIWLATVPILFVLVGFCGVGHGVATPAANNACIELMPDKVATITGLRGMFRNIGSTLGIAMSTLLLNVIPDQQRAFQVVFFAPVVLLLFAIPTIFMMPSCPEEAPASKQPTPAKA